MLLATKPSWVPAYRNAKSRPARTPRPRLVEWPGRLAAPAIPLTVLLELDLGTRLLELLLQLLRLVLVHAFLDRLARALDEILGLLEAEARDRADLLDHVDLLVARAGEDDGKLSLLCRRGGSTRGSAAGDGGDGDRRGRGHAPLLLQHLGEFGGFDDGERREVVDQFG